MISKIKPEELKIFQTLRHPVACAEILFNNVDDLASFSPDKFGKIRKYQVPMLSYDSLYIENNKKTSKENFKIKQGLSEMYALGGRMTGKSRVSLIIDSLISIFNKTFFWGAISSCDLNHVKGVMDDIVISMRNHPIMKLFNRSITKAPSYMINTKNGIKLESVNNNLSGKNPAQNWFGKHIDKNWEEEAGFLTFEVTKKKLMAVAEKGCIFRYSGMTTFPKNSPMGKVFYDITKKNKILNIPTYANPYYNKQKDDDAIKEYGGKNSHSYEVQILGKIVEHGDCVFDMERVRETYKCNKKTGEPISCINIEINKDNFYKYKEMIIVDKPKNAEQTWITLDKGEGSAPTEIAIFFIINNTYVYKYNITLFKLKMDEDEEIINYIVEKLEANIISIDGTSGSGKSIICNLAKKYPENVIAVNFNEKIKVDIERDDKGEYKTDINGNYIYKKERMVDWSIQQIKDIFYNKKIKCFYDFKLDTQLNDVVAITNGTHTLFKGKNENHLFQAFQCLAIAHWLINFKNIEPIRIRRPGMGVFKNV